MMILKCTSLVAFFFHMVFILVKANDNVLDGIAILIKCHEMQMVPGIKTEELHLPLGGIYNEHYAVEPYFSIGNQIVTCLLSHFGMNADALLTLHLEIQEEPWVVKEREILENQLLVLLHEREEHKEDLLKLREINAHLEDWRKRLVALSLAYKDLHLFVIKRLFHFLLEVDDVLYVLTDKNIDMQHYFRMRDHLEDKITNNEALLRDIQRNSAEAAAMLEPYGNVKQEIMSKIYDYIQLVNSDINNASKGKLSDYWWKKGQQALPKPKRVLWLVRSAEHLDNILTSENEEDHKNKPFHCDVFQNEHGHGRREFWRDNCPLSPRGKNEQGPKLEEVFKSIQIDHIFASPMERTVDTATRLLGAGHQGLQIKLEPGLIERLDFCRKPPSYHACKKLQREGGYKRLDCEHVVLFRKQRHHHPNTSMRKVNSDSDFNDDEEEDIIPENSVVVGIKELLSVLPEKEGQMNGENDVLERVETVLEYILKYYNRQNGHNRDRPESYFQAAKNKIYGKVAETVNKWLPGEYEHKEWLWPGEEHAEHIVIVTHNAVIGAIHKLINKEWNYVAQTSISKFVEYDGMPSDHHHGGEASSSRRKEYQDFRLIFSSETKHLGKTLQTNGPLRCI